MAGSLVGLLLAVSLGFVSFTSGTLGQGGTECGSVWLVAAYYGGCADRLDAVAFIVFAGIGLTSCLIVIGFERTHRVAGWAIPVAVVVGLGIAVLGPRIWKDAVFLNFGY